MAVESRPGDSGNSITMKIDIVDAGAVDAGAADAGAVDAGDLNAQCRYQNLKKTQKYSNLT
jgi:hypothetical protein